MDGKNEIGSITNYDSIIHDGQEMGRGKSAYTFETLGLFYQSLVDTGKPINAEVFSKLHGNKTRLLQVKWCFESGSTKSINSNPKYAYFNFIKHSIFFWSY